MGFSTKATSNPRITEAWRTRPEYGDIEVRLLLDNDEKITVTAGMRYGGTVRVVEASGWSYSQRGGDRTHEGLALMAQVYAEAARIAESLAAIAVHVDEGHHSHPLYSHDCGNCGEANVYYDDSDPRACDSCGQTNPAQLLGNGAQYPDRASCGICQTAVKIAQQVLHYRASAR